LFEGFYDTLFWLYFSAKKPPEGFNLIANQDFEISVIEKSPKMKKLFHLLMIVINEEGMKNYL
jgi:hypothetical protein